MIDPAVFGDSLVEVVVTLNGFGEGLLLHSVKIFVKTINKVRQELLRVVLLIALELMKR